MSTSYNDLVNVSWFGKKREEFSMERWSATLYCHDCQKFSDLSSIEENTLPKTCPLCGENHLSFGTRLSLEAIYSRKRR